MYMKDLKQIRWLRPMSTMTSWVSAIHMAEVGLHWSSAKHVKVPRLLNATMA